MRAAQVRQELSIDLKEAIKSPLLRWALNLVLKKVLEVIVAFLLKKGLIVKGEAIF